MQKKTVLCVGLVCLDVVVRCNSFPEEDSDQRGQSVQWKRGGNATNNCTVLKQYDVDCEFLGTISSDVAGRFLKEDMISRNIPIDNCITVENSECPTSCVMINSQNGSRTIVHCRNDFPEYSYESFLKINLSKYGWFHFEGRDVENTKKMIEHVRKWRLDNDSNVPISVEIEKNRPHKMALLPCADFVFIDKVFAMMLGYSDMQSAVKGLSSKIRPGAVLICAWGEHGACARDTTGEIIISPSFPPPRMMDTLGAGDTFVASTICALHRGHTVQEAIRFGCRMAGAKCGINGLVGLKGIYEKSKIFSQSFS